MSISISAASPEDIDALVASVAGLFREDAGKHDHSVNVAWPEMDGAGYYADVLAAPACLLALARDGNDVVGHLVGKLVGPDSFRAERMAVLESMRVAPGARRQGVGGQLVAAFLDWAHRHSAQLASVTAYAANSGAQRFYQRHGFTPHAVTLRTPVPLPPAADQQHTSPHQRPIDMR